MCRVAGILSKHNTDVNLKQWVNIMANAMQNGGPDDDGLYVSENNKVAFSHRRLSILDLSSVGHQPMYSSDKQVVISFNGEIYNFKEIRFKLEAQGYVFCTNTDTEVIINAYQCWGEHSFSLYRGMFAFLLHDIPKELIYVARGPLGIKPLYVFEDEHFFIFTSEIRALEKLPIQLNENPDWEMYFLVFGFIPEPFTIYKNVKMLPKSHFLKINTINNEAQTHRYSPELINYEFDKENILKDTRQQLIDSVKAHLISDAPMGVFLSGGIDSSLISIIAAENQKSQIKTLSLNFDVDSYNETQYQNLIVNQIKSEHISEIITYEDFSASISDFIQALDQPTSDAINTYFVSLAAKKCGLKAVLSGLGADELLGGYPSFGRAKYFSFIQKYIPNFLLKSVKNLADSKFKKFEYLAIPDNLGKYLCNRGIFSASDVAKYLDLSFDDVFNKLTPFYFDNETKNKSEFEVTSWYETNIYMHNQLLRDSDVMSMWHGVELRVPFVDVNFNQFIAQIPAKYKNTKIQKKLLIDSFIGDLPKEIWDRPKKGFTLPFQIWVGKYKEILETVRANSKFEPVVIEFLKGNVHWSRIWVLYVLIIWKNKMRNRNSA